MTFPAWAWTEPSNGQIHPTHNTHTWLGKSATTAILYNNNIMSDFSLKKYKIHKCVQKETDVYWQYLLYSNPLSCTGCNVTDAMVTKSPICFSKPLKYCSLQDERLKLQIKMLHGWWFAVRQCLTKKRTQIKKRRGGWFRNSSICVWAAVRSLSWAEITE